MAKVSAGLLLYRLDGDDVEFLLVHPGGPFWQNKDKGVWSIPKGEFDPETEEPLTAALREFTEELGHEPPSGPYTDLGEITQKAGKRVLAWAAQGDLDPSTVVSNTFTMEWPPKSGQTTEFPEIDRATWFSRKEAKTAINPAQIPFLERLLLVLP
jgi:predicted NUDIX family NTP pyrophosphohydrolase